MARSFQITFDCVSVAAQASFWAAALGYEVEAPPDGAASWVEYFEAPLFSSEIYSAVVAIK